MNTLFLIDGNALIHRAYHAYPHLSTKNDIPTNAVYGFAMLLNQALSQFRPTHVAVCFDTPEPTFRNKLYVNYQIQRPQADTDLIVQFPIVHQFVDEAGLLRFEKIGFEADDVIGTISRIASEKDFNVIILTGDKDILQLVDEKVSVVTPLLGLRDIKVYTPKEVIERFGIEPHYIPDLKGLIGDSSDNYPGVKGIGPKTATTLLQKFETVEGIYNHLEDVENKKVKILLETYKKDAFLSKELATIDHSVDITFDIEKCAFLGYSETLKPFLEKMEFKSLISRYFPVQKAKEKIVEKKPETNQMNLF